MSSGGYFKDSEGYDRSMPKTRATTLFHVCRLWEAEGNVGSVWICKCGAYWKRHSASLTRTRGWRQMTWLELWRFKRMQRKQKAHERRS